ncbi:MAG: chromosomal replication initiator protein DnaA [Clostridia bacterium]|nr:chromosomal replication initiator protein DnaA [Clostridia bacterium]
MNEKDICRIVVEKLEKEHDLTDMAIKLWFDNLSLERLTPDTAYFSTDNDLKKSIIESKYIDYLKEDLKDILGFDVKVVVLSSEGSSSDAQIKEMEKKKETEQLKEVAEKLEAEDQTVNNPDFVRVYDEEESKKMSSKIFVSRSLPNYSPEYTFDNFVVGRSNDIAYNMAYSVAERPATVANPLFLYGSPGLGKTHLLYAITREIATRHPEFTIIYVKGEDFTNELIEALANKTSIMFREKYRNADVLLLDDIQFIAGKEAIQEEFFHTYEALFESGKQIILTSDRLPKDIKSLAERLRSRFEHGIIVDIQPPDLELRVAIFKRKAQAFGMNIPNDVLMYLGENIKDNIRQIEGALKKMRALAYIQNADICMEHAKTAVNDILTAKAAAITPDKIITYVSQKTGIAPEEIVGKRKTNEIAMARQVSIYLLRELTEMSYENVGKVFNRDHSTVVSAVKKIKEMMDKDSSFEAQIDDMVKDMRSIGD